MTLSQGKPLHANCAVLLGPAVACQAQRILRPLSQVALLLCQTSSSTGVKVGGGLNFCSNPEGLTESLSCCLKFLLLIVLL